LIVRAALAGGREQYLVRWGLIPSWVKDPRALSTLINARAETAAEKPSFRGAMRHRRCLVPATGFYEWTGKPGAKKPHLIRPRHGGLMAMAGLAEHWVGADGSELETMAILTTAPNATMRPIHDRMPVILNPADFDLWLDCSTGTAKFAETLLVPPPDDLLEVVDVSPRLNNPRNEGPDLHLLP
jgi:putative SOS response-associated peptidase YedK